MEERVNRRFLGNGLDNMSAATETDVKDVRTLATSYVMFQIGKSLFLFLQSKKNNCGKSMFMKATLF